MGREEAIRDSRFMIIGYYEYMPNGDITVKNFKRFILGYYRKSRDVTVDFHGRIIARGNAVGMLLAMDSSNK